MSNHIAVEEHATHYKTFLHWDDADQPLVTIFTDMVDPQESRPRLEHKFSCIVFPDALITNWDRSGELLSSVPDVQLPPGIERGYIYQMSREASASVTDRSEVSQVSEVEQSYLEAIRSVKTFQEVLQRHINGNAYSTRTIDPSLNTVFWAAGVRSTELKIELEHWWLVQTELNDQCGAHQARRIASSIVLGNTAISAMEDAATIAQQTALSEEDVAEALRKAYEDAETSSEEEDGTNGFNGFNGNGHHASALGSPMDTNA